VKGRARKPSMQGSVEKSNAPFKISLDRGMEKYPGESWAEVGAYVINAQMNQCPSQSKDNKPPYEIYYGKPI
jgi:hypothetical protein